MSGTGTTMVSSSSGTLSSSPFLLGQFLARAGPSQVDAAVVERAGDVGEVDPLEEAVGRSARRGESSLRRIAPSWMTIISPGSSDWMS